MGTRVYKQVMVCRGNRRWTIMMFSTLRRRIYTHILLLLLLLYSLGVPNQGAHNKTPSVYTYRYNKNNNDYNVI